MPSFFTSSHDTNSYSLTAEKKSRALKNQGRAFKKSKYGALIYSSKEGDGVFLNGKVKDKFNDKILCRHLAGLVIEHQIKDYHHALSRADTIANIPDLQNNTYDQNPLILQSPYYAIGAYQRFGKILIDMAKPLKPGETLPLLLSTGGHLMALSISMKKTASNKWHYVIKFYDPNKTDQHQRIICPTLKALKHLELTALLNQSSMQSYFKGSDVLAILHARKRKEGTTPELKFYANLSYHIILFFICKLNLHQELLKIIDTLNSIITSNQYNAEDLHQTLSYTAEGAPPGLFMALQDGHIECVRDLTKFVLNTPLSDKQKTSILLAKKTDGFTGFYLCALNGHEETLMTFATLILESSLINESKCEILMGLYKSSGFKFTGFYKLIHKGYNELANQFIALVLNSSLNREQKLAVLSLNPDKQSSSLREAMIKNNHHMVTRLIQIIFELNDDIDSMTHQLAAEGSLCNGLSRNNSEAVTAYTMAIVESSLPEKTKVSLILSKTFDETPALNIAFSHNSLAAIKAMMDIILASNLAPASQYKILQTASDTGMLPALFMEFHKNKFKSILVYCQTIMESNLPYLMKLDLVNPKCIGISGLSEAMRKDLHITVYQYAKWVVNSNLSVADKTDILCANNDSNIPTLYFALQDNHYKAAILFTKAILNSNLPSENQVKILGAKRPDGAPGLFLAFQSGHTKLIEKYVSLILQSRLPVDGQVALVSAIATDNSQGMHIAMKQNHAETVSVFMKAVLKSRLPSKEKLFLLESTYEGESALSAAQKAGAVEASRVFIEAIKDSDLEPCDKQSLLPDECTPSGYRCSMV